MDKEKYEQLEQFIVDNQDYFYRFAYGYVKDPEEVMDIVQNAVVKALEHYEDLRKPAFMKSWFFRILINECYASMRRKKRGEILYSPEDMEELGRAEEQGMDGVSLYEAVCNLPESMKEVVCLRFYEDMKLDEIAQACDLTLATVKYRLYAALRLLKEEYKEA